MASFSRRPRPRVGTSQPFRRGILATIPRFLGLPLYHSFHSTSLKNIVRPYLLADIGEGITECRVVRWCVKPGDKVKQFDPICEVESDKASVEITSRYDGLITRLHHEVDDMAIVGKPLLDIDVEEEDPLQTQPTSQPGEIMESGDDDRTSSVTTRETNDQRTPKSLVEDLLPAKNSGQVVPAVRLLLKEHAIDLRDIPGSGKGGRVLKEDVQHYLNSKSIESREDGDTTPNSDTLIRLTPVENQMMKSMTNALSIPHFGFTHSVDLTSLNKIRQTFNAPNGIGKMLYGEETTKITPLSILIKALSTAFHKHPKLNSHLDLDGDQKTPRLVVRGSHNFGIAVDTPKGLLVPVVKDVQDRSVISIAREIKRLSGLAKQGALKTLDLKGATFTVSNIGSIGGNVVSPVIVPPMVAIVAVGKAEDVPVWTEGENGAEIVKRQKAVLSWSADHRILDGASVAKCAQLVSTIIENTDGLGFILK